MANTDNYAMGWDDAVSNDEAGFITLPEGEYDFTVKSFERGSFPGSGGGESHRQFPESCADAADSRTGFPGFWRLDTQKRSRGGRSP